MKTSLRALATLMAVAPLHRAAGLRSMILSSYQSVSGAGAKGVRELAEQVEKLHGMEDDLANPDPASLPVGDVFGKTIAYNEFLQMLTGAVTAAGDAAKAAVDSAAKAVAPAGDAKK